MLAFSVDGTASMERDDARSLVLVLDGRGVVMEAFGWMRAREYKDPVGNILKLSV